MSTKLLLIGWDGADWNHIDPLLDAGLLPNLQRFIDQGVMGNIETLYPVLSPMLWNSIATGRLGDAHRILNFTEPNENGKGCRPFASTSRKVKAIWNILNQNGYSSNVINWWASHPAEKVNGAVISNHFLHSKFDEKASAWNHFPGTIWPDDLMEEIGELRVRLSEVRDTDILPFIPRAAEIDQTKNKKLQSLAKLIAECASLQAVNTWLLQNRPADFHAVYFEGIDHFCHGFMHYTAPKMPNVSEEDFEMFKDVVAGGYRFHDMMLGAMLRLVDDDTYVVICSDHGFQSGSGRPRFTPLEPAGPAYWHRSLGILAMRGPGVRQDERIYGANLLDIAPTILTVFGLPVAENMNGKVLTTAFETPPATEYIESWELVDGDAAMHPPGTTVDKETSDELIDQFVALGYVEDPGEDQEEAARKTQIEIDYNLARVYLSTYRPDDALPIFEQLLEDAPYERRFILYLMRCYFECGYLQQTLAFAEAAFPGLKGLPASSLAIIGRTHCRLGDIETGMELLEKARASSPSLGGLFVELARVYYRLREWEKVIECCDQELDRNPAAAQAIEFKGIAQLKLGQVDESIDTFLEAIGIRYQMPQSHYHMGMALLKRGDAERALVALRAAVTYQPNLVAAHRMISRLARDRGQEELANTHLAQSIAFRGDNRDQKHQLRGRREQRFEITDLPAPAERRELLIKNRPMLHKKKEVGTSGKTFLLVSGLPRSGTSLMMQMLAAGGIPPQTDSLRVADESNPEGYYEWEAIKQIAKQPELLDEAGVDQRAIKVISILLPKLPRQHSYKIIFMDRPVAEVVRSQRKMIERTPGMDIPQEDDAMMSQQLSEHRNQIRNWIAGQANFEFLNVSYPDLVTKPELQIERVEEFLGDRLPHPRAMESAIRSDLYRNRKS